MKSLLSKIFISEKKKPRMIDLQGLLKNFFSEKIIHRLAIPRAKMDCVQESLLLKDAIQYIIKTGRSRLPVLNKSGEFVGILFVKDIFSCISKLSTKKVKNIMRPAIKISYTSSINNVLQEMKNKKSHLVLIVDEYGGVDGLVTMEDIVEEIVGNIEDEFDNEKPEYKKEKGIVVVNSDMPLEEFNKVFGFSLQEERVDTIGGYICFLAKRIPKKGEIFHLSDKKVEIKSATKKKLKTINLFT